jgi:hypothetical protein
MTESKPSETDVVDWIRRHPDFLERHPELLAELDAPVERGAASLLQRQVQVLRDDNQRLKRQLRHLSGVAGENQRLMQRLHRLALELVSAGDIAELFGRLDEGLRRDFRADAVCLLLDAAEGPGSDHALVRTMPAPPAEWLAELLDRGQPLCGRLTRDKRETVFGKNGAALGSAALVPLNGRSLVAIGAACDQRFHADMGTLFLELLRTTLRFRMDLESGAPGRQRARA